MQPRRLHAAVAVQAAIFLAVPGASAARVPRPMRDEAPPWAMERAEIVHAMRNIVPPSAADHGPASDRASKPPPEGAHRAKRGATDGTVTNPVCVDYTNDEGYYASRNAGLTPSIPAGYHTRPATISTCELEQLHDECVERINMYRSGALRFSDGSQDSNVRAGLAPLEHTTGNNECSSQQALGDLRVNVASGDGCQGAHHTAGTCWGQSGRGGMAQNACCARGGGAWGWQTDKIVTYDLVKEYLFECLQDMWDEGVTPGQKGHWETMRNPDLGAASCGFAWNEEGRIFMNQDFTGAPPDVVACSCDGKAPGDPDGCGGVCKACSESAPAPCEDADKTNWYSTGCTGPTRSGNSRYCTCADFIDPSKSWLGGCGVSGISSMCPQSCDACPAPANTCPANSPPSPPPPPTESTASTTTPTTADPAPGFTFAGDGCCRQPDGGSGVFEMLAGLSFAECMAACAARPGCAAFEHQPSLACEIHTEAIDHGSGPGTDCTCYVKDGDAPQPSETPPTPPAPPAPPPTTMPPPPPPPGGTDIYEEVDCVVAFEIESAPLVDSWTRVTALGAVAYRWDGDDLFNSQFAGTEGLMTYDFHVNEPGLYKVNIRNMHTNPDSTESNDCWLRMDSGGWVKVYSEKVNEWHWMSKMELSHADKERTAQFTLAAGHHRLALSGRSHGFYMDRVHIWAPHCAGSTPAVLDESRPISPLLGETPPPPPPSPPPPPPLSTPTTVASTTAASGGGAGAAWSASTCEQLGWGARSLQTWSRETVCGDSIPSCPGFVSHSQAKDMCEAANARLCTSDELLDNVARGSGCNLDFALTWTGEACPGGFVVAAGSTKSSAASECRQSTDPGVRGVRCCGDVEAAPSTASITTPTTRSTTATTRSTTATTRSTTATTGSTTATARSTTTTITTTTVPTTTTTTKVPTTTVPTTTTTTTTTTTVPTTTTTTTTSTTTTTAPSTSTTTSTTSSPSAEEQLAQALAALEEVSSSLQEKVAENSALQNQVNTLTTQLDSCEGGEGPSVITSSATTPTTRSTTQTTRSTTTTTKTTVPATTTTTTTTVPTTTTTTTTPTASSSADGGKSSRSCAQFGWSATRSKQTWTRNSVCAESVKCFAPQQISFEEARSECESVGARLCSADELGDNVARGTGCNLDKKFVWTKSGCAGGGIFAAPASTKLVAAAVCKDQSAGRAAGLRCCADVF